MAMSIKNVENPVTEISRTLCKMPVGRTSRNVFFFVRKCDAITRIEITVPMAVASPAPKAPISQVNTKK